MSNTATRLCRALPMSPAQKAVLMCIADRANDAGVAWPSLPGICEWTCLGRTAVIEAMKWLAANNLIVVTKATGKNNSCTLALAHLAALQPDDQYGKRTTSEDEPEGEPVRQMDPTSPADGPPPVREADYTRPADGPEASISITQAPVKHQEKTRGQKKLVVDLAEEQLPEWMPRSAWSSYVDMRRSIKSVMTTRAQELLVGRISKLRDAGSDPEALLEAATIGNWKSVYADRGYAQPSGNAISRGRQSIAATWSDPT